MILGRRGLFIDMTAQLATLQSQWQSGRVTNLQYVMFLNFMAGRNMVDLSAYPILPQLHLSMSNQCPRNLSRAIGNQSEKQSQ